PGPPLRPGAGPGGPAPLAAGGGRGALDRGRGGEGPGPALHAPAGVGGPPPHRAPPGPRTRRRLTLSQPAFLYRNTAEEERRFQSAGSCTTNLAPPPRAWSAQIRP